MLKWPRTVIRLATLSLAVVAGGCGSRISSVAEINAFTQAARSIDVDRSKLVQGRVPSRPYRVGKGDVLNIRLVNVVNPMTEIAWQRDEPGSAFRCRVDETGSVVLPFIGRLPVEGKTVNEVEATVSDAYYPRYVSHDPNIYVQVEEYRTTAVSVIGAVDKPGICELRRDEMTLVSALMKSGGISNTGATAIRIYSDREDGAERKIVLPVHGMNTPFTDVALEPGDVIEVERQGQDYFLITGLVKKPGAYIYPPDRTYTVAQALAFAGGPNDISPGFITVYRRTREGTISTIRVSKEGSDATSASRVAVKPGDIIEVEQTFGTKTRTTFGNILRGGLFVGANYDLAQ